MRLLPTLRFVTAVLGAVQDNVSEHPERFFVGEIIREKIFMLYHDEVPYASTVRGVA
jgi:GTPase Era involved in 16S rRNA processing